MVDKYTLRLPCVVICGTALPSAGSGVLKTVVDVKCVLTIVRKNASVMCIGFLSCRDRCKMGLISTYC